MIGACRLAACALVLGGLLASARAAGGYPEKPITLVIPFPPGGSTGFTAKVMAEEMQKIVKQPVTVEPRIGNFGINAIADVVGKTDGYRLMVGSIITNSMTPVMHRSQIRFDYDKEIIPITRLAAFPSVLMAAPAMPADSLKDALARLKGSSGRLRFGTDFPGTYVDADFIMLGKAADLKVSIRSANGALAILNDLVEGRIDLAMLNVATASANIGKYKPLAVTGTRRLSNFPAVPTMAEAGFPRIGTSNWQGLFAAQVSSDIVDALHGIAIEAMNSPRAKAEFAGINAEIVTSESSTKFAAEIRTEMADWEKLVPEVLGLPAEQ